MTKRREHFCNGDYCQVKTIWTIDFDFNDDGEFVAHWVCNNCGRREAKRVVNFNVSKDRKPNAMQQDSINFIRNFLSRDFSEKYGEDFTRFEIEGTGYDRGFWLSAETEYLGLPENNVLRATSHGYWFIYIGPRGKIEANQYPRHFEQFKGQKAFGHINFK